MTFPTKESGTWNLDRSKRDEWTEAYPEIDVLGELQKARQWLKDNTDRLKTSRGMSRFLGGWLARAKPPERSENAIADAEAIMEQHAREVLVRKRAELAERAELAAKGGCS